MASNFKILTHRQKDQIQLTLSGDFDGSSALELLDKLKANNKNVGSVIVNTCGLSQVHPFGQGVFQRLFCINKLSGSVEFKGKYGDTLKPCASTFI